jgi:DNA-binding MarR family transcriptional regulator
MADPRHVWHVVNLLQAATMLRAELEAALTSEVGFTLAEHDVMMSLLHHGARLPMGELAELVMFSQSGITRLVDRLERKGFVRREFSPDDRRLCYGVLTQAGERKLRKEAMPLVDRIVTDRFTRHVSDEDAAQLRRILLDVLRGNGWWDERRRTQGPLPGERARD